MAEAFPDDHQFPPYELPDSAFESGDTAIPEGTDRVVLADYGSVAMEETVSIDELEMAGPKREHKVVPIRLPRAPIVPRQRPEREKTVRPSRQDRRTRRAA
jgi:hypothetical protein